VPQLNANLAAKIVQMFKNFPALGMQPYPCIPMPYAYVATQMV